MEHNDYLEQAVALLRRLIATPSVSRDEARSADVTEETMRSCGLSPRREANNVWAVSPYFDDGRPHAGHRHGA